MSSALLHAFGATVGDGRHIGHIEVFVCMGEGLPSSMSNIFYHFNVYNYQMTHYELSLTHSFEGTHRFVEVVLGGLSQPLLQRVNFILQLPLSPTSFTLRCSSKVALSDRSAYTHFTAFRRSLILVWVWVLGG